MSSPTHSFLSLIPTAHRVAVITPFVSSVETESVIPVLQKTRRSSSTATTDSNPADEPTLPTETVSVADPINAPQFLKLGN